MPTEYIINYHTKDKLPAIDLVHQPDDIIFFLFHTNCGDLLQLQAASILYDRDWRYHIEKRFWLTRMPGHEIQKADTYEKGIYIVFDVGQWKKVQVELTVEYSKLAEKPQQQSKNATMTTSTTTTNEMNGGNNPMTASAANNGGAALNGESLIESGANSSATENNGTNEPVSSS